MPTVKDKITGEVISEQKYNKEGIQNAETIANSNPQWNVVNAPDRMETYAEGGRIYRGDYMYSGSGKFLGKNPKTKEDDEMLYGGDFEN